MRERLAEALLRFLRLPLVEELDAQRASRPRQELLDLGALRWSGRGQGRLETPYGLEVLARLVRLDALGPKLARLPPGAFLLLGRRRADERQEEEARGKQLAWHADQDASWATAGALPAGLRPPRRLPSHSSRAPRARGSRSPWRRATRARTRRSSSRDSAPRRASRSSGPPSGRPWGRRTPGSHRSPRGRGSCGNHAGSARSP